MEEQERRVAGFGQLGLRQDDPVAAERHLAGRTLASANLGLGLDLTSGEESQSAGEGGNKSTKSHRATLRFSSQPAIPSRLTAEGPSVSVSPANPCR